jgi:hypothetical protein
VQPVGGNHLYRSESGCLFVSGTPVGSVSRNRVPISAVSSGRAVCEPPPLKRGECPLTCRRSSAKRRVNCLDSRREGGESGGGARQDGAVEKRKTPESEEGGEKAMAEAETPKMAEGKHRAEGRREEGKKGWCRRGTGGAGRAKWKRNRGLTTEGMAGAIPGKVTSHAASDQPRNSPEKLMESRLDRDGQPAWVREIDGTDSPSWGSDHKS